VGLRPVPHRGTQSAATSVREPSVPRVDGSSDMNQAHKGRRAEHRVRKVLEDDGFMVTRAAGSKGPADLIAWNTVQIRFISVKSGTKYASAIEREALKDMPAPPNATKEIWRLPDRCREPIIEVL
jgi:hypothetical protein